MTNRIGFNLYAQPIIRGKNIYEFRYYLIPRMVVEDSITVGGRGTGKSYEMEADIPHTIIISPSVPCEEILLSSLRELHMKQRMESVITFVNNLSVFKMFRTKINRQPHYKIIVYGIRNKIVTLNGISVGDDPLAKNLEGTHSYYKFIEECQQFPESAYLRYTGASAGKGTCDRYLGVNDGRQDSPFYKFQTKSKRFDKKVYRIPTLLEPNWTQARKQEKIEALKGEDSDDYVQQVLALTGSPRSAVWDLKDIYGCANYRLKYREMAISPNDYENQDFDDFLIHRFQELIKPDGEVIIGFDPAYSADSHISIFSYENSKWRLIQTIIMRNKVIHINQTKVISYLINFYGASIGIDCTSADGRDIAHELIHGDNYKDKNYKDRIFMAEYSSKIFMGEDFDKEKNEMVKKFEDVKEYTTNFVRKYFSQGRFEIPLEEDILSDFNAESIKVTARKKVIATPSNVHRPDTFRMFAYVLFQKDYNPAFDSEVQEFVMPEWVENPINY